MGLFKSAPDFRALSSTFSQNKRSFCHLDVLLVLVIPLFSLHSKDPCLGSCPKHFLPTPEILLTPHADRVFIFTAISLWICVFCSLQSKNRFWQCWKSLWLWSTFLYKIHSNLWETLGAIAEKHRNISAFWEIIHSHSSPRIILKQQGCFNTWRWKLHSCTWLWGGNVPKTGLGELEPEPFLRLDTMLAGQISIN